MTSFASLHNRRQDVRNVRISSAFAGFGRAKVNARVDWVFRLLEAFTALEEVLFVFGDENESEEVRSHCVVENALRVWWECVVDAVREGIAVRGQERRGKKAMLVLRVEFMDFKWNENICSGN
ncbi:uncharacterized protein RSE6_05946 [Rhynchosporium secalis]|uniref:Uncharacterized protein n=1 Tax=Rhynchosporium secalis TaxID=38038 RepID=A0A1E1M941_RHYSE|nr:uncharacterized protein RSE6_05946 [Rhynchosporium secalis]